jgi:hypothetical protein
MNFAAPTLYLPEGALPGAVTGLTPVAHSLHNFAA